MSVPQLPARSVSSTLAGLVPLVDHVPHLGPDDLARTLWPPTPASVPTVPTALTLETLTLHAAQQGQLLHQWAAALETRPALPTGLVTTLVALADEAARRQAAARFLARTDPPLSRTQLSQELEHASALTHVLATPDQHSLCWYPLPHTPRADDQATFWLGSLSTTPPPSGLRWRGSATAGRLLGAPPAWGLAFQPVQLEQVLALVQALATHQPSAPDLWVPLARTWGPWLVLVGRSLWELYAPFLTRVWRHARTELAEFPPEPAGVLTTGRALRAALDPLLVAVRTAPPRVQPATADTVPLTPVPQWDGTTFTLTFRTRSTYLAPQANRQRILLHALQQRRWQRVPIPAGQDAAYSNACKRFNPGHGRAVGIRLSIWHHLLRWEPIEVNQLNPERAVA